ncbi:YIEGIA family protein [Paenibacillus pasadenensis]|uniref:Putative membrane protein n=1 Tax=Paenibacillus pasadenensis TaxID=217090 RepID=A0A2N5N5Q4_9BACL|nr:YIEGIA family protein [Paenibacillus pasadenensis]PLT45630.1 putative membrane protein [Paenibacillus pasadenensis]
MLRQIQDYFEANQMVASVLIGIGFGVIARLLLLRSDYRQYPTFPHGQIIHLSLGFIASALGAVAVPALYQKNLTAITFLTVAAQQFRDVRNMERETLSKMDSMELVSRGTSYIEGIAMVFEGRNYLVILAAMTASLGSVAINVWAGLLGGLLALAAVWKLRSGKSVSHIADVQAGELRMDGPDLYVDDIYIMNVGLESDQQIIRERGLGLVLAPRNANGRVTLSNIGQRQAILYDLSTILGVHRDTGEPALLPMAKLDMDSGRLGVFILPHEKDESKALEIAGRVPLLETAVRMPSKAGVNQEAKDNG